MFRNLSEVRKRVIRTTFRVTRGHSCRKKENEFSLKKNGDFHYYIHYILFTKCKGQDLSQTIY